MRGKVMEQYVKLEELGITPAYAGKSWWISSRRPGRRDHPRVCGEKKADAAYTTCAVGSPPRMRGKVAVGALYCQCSGITPAYAGKRVSFAVPGSLE